MSFTITYWYCAGPLQSAYYTQTSHLNVKKINEHSQDVIIIVKYKGPSRIKNAKEWLCKLVPRVSDWRTWVEKSGEIVRVSVDMKFIIYINRQDNHVTPAAARRKLMFSWRAYARGGWTPPRKQLTSNSSTSSDLNALLSCYFSKMMCNNLINITGGMCVIPI